MKIIRALASAAILAGLATGSACAKSPEHQADQASPTTTHGTGNAATMNGHFTATYTKGGASSNVDWYFTPCGDGCAQVAIGHSGSAPLQAHLVDGRWVLENNKDSGRCPDGSTPSNGTFASRMVWDPTTLGGTVQQTLTQPGCGVAAGTAMGEQHLQLKQAT